MNNKAASNELPALLSILIDEIALGVTTSAQKDETTQRSDQ